MAEPGRIAKGTGLNVQRYRQMKIAILARHRLLRIILRGHFPASLRHRQGLRPVTRFLGVQASKGPLADLSVGLCPVHHYGFREGVHRCLVSPEGASPWTSGCAGRSGGVGRTIGAALSLEGLVVPGADVVRGRRERDKLTISDVCADLGVSRRTFYEWRAKGRAPRCITLPNGSLRIRRSEYQRWLASREEAA